MYEIGAIQSKIFNTVLSNWEECIQIIDSINSNKKSLENILKKKSPSVLECEGNFSLFKLTSELEKSLDELCYYRKKFQFNCLKNYSRLSAPSKSFIKQLEKSLNK